MSDSKQKQSQKSQQYPIIQNSTNTQMKNCYEFQSNQYSEQNSSGSNSSIPCKGSPLNSAPYQYYPSCIPTHYQYPNLMYKQSQSSVNSNQQQISNNQTLAQPVPALTAVYPYPQYYASYPTFVQTAIPVNVAAGGYQMCVFPQGISLPIQQNSVNYQKQENLQLEQRKKNNTNTSISDKCVNDNNLTNNIKIEKSQSIELPNSSTRSIQMQIQDYQNKNQDHNICLKSHSEETYHSQNTFYIEKSEKFQDLFRNSKKNKNEQSYLNKRKNQSKTIDTSICKCQNLNDEYLESESPRNIKKIKASTQQNKQLSIQNKITAHIQSQCNQQNQSKIFNSYQSQHSKTISISKPQEKYNMKIENSIQKTKYMNHGVQNELNTKITGYNEQKYKSSEVELQSQIKTGIFNCQLAQKKNKDNFLQQEISPEIKKELNQNSLSPILSSFISSETTESEKMAEQISGNNNSIQIKAEDKEQLDHSISIDFDEIESIDFENNYPENSVNKKINILNILQEFSISQPKTQKQKKFKQSSDSITSKTQQKLKKFNKKNSSDQNTSSKASNQSTNKKQLSVNKKISLDKQPTISKQESIQSENTENTDQQNSFTEQSNEIHEQMKKGNCVKNVIKAFQNWCKDEVTDETIIQQYPGYGEEELTADQIRKKLNRYLKNKIPNHQNLQRLVDHPKFGKLLLHFIQKPALDWIASSTIKNKEQHLQFINLLSEKWENPNFFEDFIKILKRKKNLVTNKLLLQDKFYDSEISS